MTTRYLQLHRRTRSLGRTREYARLVRVHGPVIGDAYVPSSDATFACCGCIICECTLCPSCCARVPRGKACRQPVCQANKCPRCPHDLHPFNACTSRNGGTAYPCPCLGSGVLPEPAVPAPVEPAALSVVTLEAELLGYAIHLSSGDGLYRWSSGPSKLSVKSWERADDAARDALRFHAEQQAVAAPVPVRAADALPYGWRDVGVMCTGNREHVSGAVVREFEPGGWVWWMAADHRELSFEDAERAFKPTMHAAMAAALQCTEADLWPSVQAVEGGGAHG